MRNQDCLEGINDEGEILGEGKGGLRRVKDGFRMAR